MQDSSERKWNFRREVTLIPGNHIATTGVGFEDFPFLASSAAWSLTQVSPNALAKWSSTANKRVTIFTKWYLAKK